MAVTFSKIWKLKGSDIVEEYFIRSQDAELCRQKEFDAVRLIQKTWRGYMVRKHLQNVVHMASRIQCIFRGYRARKYARLHAALISKQKRINFFGGMATRIQKVWRGYYSRKCRFDYYARKNYIESLKIKMEEMRSTLRCLELSQVENNHHQKLLQTTQKLERLAGNRHHLLGTVAVPGVYSRVKTANALEQEQGELSIPESKIRKNETILNWIKENLSMKSKLKFKQHPLTNEQKSEKISQGPFLPKAVLVQRKTKPQKPSLRVQTNYYDTREAIREQKRIDLSRRVSAIPFVVKKQPPGPKHEYFLKGEPYVPFTNNFFQARKPREVSPGTRKPFRNVLPPLHAFDELENSNRDY